MVVSTPLITIPHMVGGGALMDAKNYVFLVM